MAGRGKKQAWDADGVRGLRRHMQLTQEQLAEALGVRQQTVSEWETGLHAPRGASGRMLTIVAEEAAFPYAAGEAQGASDARAGGEGDSAAAGR